MSEPDRWLITADLKHQMSLSARELRRRATKSEQLLWQALRGEQLGVKFRRQQPIGNFIVDFYASAARLVVEVDGPIHEEQRDNDRDRQALLESLGLRVARFPAEFVETSLPAVLDAIRKLLAEDPHP